MSATPDALAELERRVTEKYTAAAQTRQPDLSDAFDPSSWSVDDLSPQCLDELAPSVDLPQFPREQWVTWPNRRTVALMLADRLLDFDELTDDHWRTISILMMLGGRERIA